MAATTSSRTAIEATDRRGGRDGPDRERSPSRRPLAVGLIAGYLGGHLQGRTPQPLRPAGAASPLSSQRSTPQNTAPALGATGNLCAVQHGTTLQLGVEVANQSDQALAVGDFRAVLPIGGLRATVQRMLVGLAACNSAARQRS